MRLSALTVCLLAAFPVRADSGRCIPERPTLLLDNCSGSLTVDLVLIPDRERVPRDWSSGQSFGLVVTGAYTNGVRIEPEGFVLDHGTIFDPYIQGWDGLLLIDSEGSLSLHHVSRVAFGGQVSNLRNDDERRAFIRRAEKEGMSAIQSHLLVTDGVLDVRPLTDAPRFRRRVLFFYEDGRFGIFDSGDRALTLYEAGREVLDDYAPHMAFNLDMGSYDYCARVDDGQKSRCGTLSRAATAKLSNVLVFREN